mmetsp:Transcript_470/g.1180  ORF Transcript_470/g.1180 Transcript_470/m.1180 type:complete len:105 (+) Transcript_470:1069-1383(+)
MPPSPDPLRSGRRQQEAQRQAQREALREAQWEAQREAQRLAGAAATNRCSGCVGQRRRCQRRLSVRSQPILVRLRLPPPSLALSRGFAARHVECRRRVARDRQR